MSNVINLTPDGWLVPLVPFQGSVLFSAVSRFDIQQYRWPGQPWEWKALLLSPLTASIPATTAHGGSTG